VERRAGVVGPYVPVVAVAHLVVDGNDRHARLHPVAERAALPAADLEDTPRGKRVEDRHELLQFERRLERLGHAATGLPTTSLMNSNDFACVTA
jgi:hypothetical protein